MLSEDVGGAIVLVSGGIPGRSTLIVKDSVNKILIH